MFKPLGNRSAFTLIELLVVIAIIAILASILFPVFASAKERGRQVKCLSNLRQLSSAFRVYMDDNDGRLPAVGWTMPNWVGCPAAQQPFKLGRGQIWPYTKNKEIYICPTDKGRKAKYVSGQPKDYPISYSMNSCIELKRPEWIQGKKLSQMLLLIHEDRTWINDGIFVAAPDYGQDIPDNVHYNGTTVVYLDGHAKWGSYNALQTERKAGLWWVDGSRQ